MIRAAAARSNSASWKKWLRGETLWKLCTTCLARTRIWICYHTIASTSADQIAIAPAYLKRQWHENGRNYFEYDMGSTNIANFHACLSGRYKVRREQYKGTTATRRRPA